MNKGLLLDIMLKDRFVCQLRYMKRGTPVMIDGKIVETYDEDEIRKFIEEVRPSLKGKNYKVEYAKQMIYAY